MSLSNNFKDDEIKKETLLLWELKKKLFIVHFYFLKDCVQDSTVSTSYQNGAQLPHKE